MSFLLIVRLHSFFSTLSASPTFKRLCTLVVLIFTLVIAYRRVQRGRQAEQRYRQRRNRQQANTNILQVFTQPQPVLSPSAKYLTPVAAKQPQRVVVISSNECLIDTQAGRVKDEVVDVLIQLAKCCKLYIITQCANDKDSLDEVSLSALRSAGLTEVLFPSYRLLCCTTAKGQSAMMRQLEPDLIISNSREVVELMRPYIGDVIHITDNSSLYTELPIKVTSQQVTIAGVTQNNPSNNHLTLRSINNFFSYKSERTTTSTTNDSTSNPASTSTTNMDS